MASAKEAPSGKGGGAKPAAQRGATNRFSLMKPFVQHYAPYTEGTGMRLAADPVKDAEKMWNNYYKQNATLGFKDRHYLTREVEEIRTASVLLECGCGVGNAFFPLLEEHPRLTCYAFDLSKVAVTLIKQSPQYDANRLTVFQHDLTAAPLPDTVPDSVADLATLIFVLSAVTPDKMRACVRHIAAKVKPGGLLYFRDYCRGDFAQKRFKSSARIDENFFMRTCGTCSYFFDREELQRFFSPWFEPRKVDVIERDIENRKESVTMHRLWIQAKFVRTDASAEEAS